MKNARNKTPNERVFFEVQVSSWFELKQRFSLIENALKSAKLKNAEMLKFNQ